jgi:hypothetical protein
LKRLLVALIISNATSVFASIQITSAIWSGKNVTAVAGSFCDGKSSCDYKISSKFLGAPQTPSSASFKIAWSCTDSADQGAIFKSHNAEGEKLNISCPVDPQHKISQTEDSAVAPILTAPKAPVAGQDMTQYLLKHQPVSFHAMIFDPSPDRVEETIGTSCSTAVRNHLRSGKTFFSKVMLQKFVIRSSEHPSSYVNRGEYFHYTKAENLRPVIQSGNLNPIFKFLRSKPFNEKENRWYWYVAADPVSSKVYGNIQIRAYFKTDSLILVTVGRVKGQTYTNAEINKIIQDDLVSRNSELKSCIGRGDSIENYTNSILLWLAAEASGVKLIAYYGIMNDHAYSKNLGLNTAQWFQVVGPWAVESAKIQ